MSTQKFGFHENYGAIKNFSHNLLNKSSCWTEMQNMELCLQTELLDYCSQEKELNSSNSLVLSQGDTMQLNPLSSDMLSTVSNCVGSSPSAFYAAECLMGFPEFEYGTNPLPLLSQVPRNSIETVPSRPSESLFCINSVKQKYIAAKPWEVLETIAKFPTQEEGNSGVSGTFQPQNPRDIHTQSSALSNHAGEDAVMDSRELVPAKGVHYPCLQGSKKLRVLSEGVPHTSTNVSHVPSAPSKSRIRWNTDLHEQFIKSVDRLGGAEKATPKAILKLMDSDGLTIYHVKSHLQKYRVAKYIPHSPEGKSERRSSMSDIQQLDPKTGSRIIETLQLQLDVQKRLHEQLEVQRTMQMRIEEQGKKLQKMLEEQMTTTRNKDEPRNWKVLFPDDEQAEASQMLYGEMPEITFSP